MSLKSILSSRSLGLNGFGSSFYVSCWDTIKKDLLEAIKDLFSGGHLPRFYTHPILFYFFKLKILLVLIN